MSVFRNLVRQWAKEEMEQARAEVIEDGKREAALIVEKARKEAVNLVEEAERGREKNPDWDRAWAALGDEAVKIVVVTGRAGTGKSTLLREWRKWAESMHQRVAVVAPTGLAAMNARGSTIHSQFCIRPSPVVDPSGFRSMGTDRETVLKKLEVLAIDEISMVRADLLDGLEHRLRTHGPQPGELFGGCRIVMFGDPLQLPPVVSGKVARKWFGGQRYPSPHFFAADAFRAAESMGLIRVVNLDRVYRQEETDFLASLDSIRVGNASPSALSLLNTRLEIRETLRLVVSRREADRVNLRCLQRLPGPEREYSAIQWGKWPGSEDGEAPRFPAPLKLRLRGGAHIIFTKNDPERRWVNGSVGKVIGRSKDDTTIRVEVNGARVSVHRACWEQCELRWSKVEGKLREEVVGRYTQFPMDLAWAMTVWKAQGMTLDEYCADLGHEAWAEGLAYVALSRARKLNGLTMARPLGIADVKCDPVAALWLMVATAKQALS